MRPEGTTACRDLMNIKFRAGTDWDSVLASSPTSWTVYIRGPKERCGRGGSVNGGRCLWSFFFFFLVRQRHLLTLACVCRRVLYACVLQKWLQHSTHLCHFLRSHRLRVFFFGFENSDKVVREPQLTRTTHKTSLHTLGRV